MLYSGVSIELLINRIGWAQAVPPTSLVVNDSNLTTESGLTFNSFHQLVTAENVFDCVQNLKISETDINAYLSKMREDSVREVLNKVFDLNILANYPTAPGVTSVNYNPSGYDDLIADKQGAFDSCIGYCMAVRSLQLFITSERSNGTQRKMKANYPYLKSELEGINDTDGNTMSNGANNQFTKAIKETIEILFPTNYREDKRILKNKTDLW